MFEKAPEELKEELFLEIKHKYEMYSERWTDDKYFQDKLNPRYKNIYENALFSDTHQEFELRVKLFEIEDKIFKLNKQNKKYKKMIENLKNENKIIKSTKGYKFIEKL